VIIENNFPIVTLDRENLREDRLQPKVLALTGRDLSLQEFLIGIDLHLDHVGWSDDLFDFTEVNSLSSGWHFFLSLIGKETSLASSFSRNDTMPMPLGCPKRNTGKKIDYLFMDDSRVWQTVNNQQTPRF